MVQPGRLSVLWFTRFAEVKRFTGFAETKHYDHLLRLPAPHLTLPKPPMRCQCWWDYHRLYKYMVICTLYLVIRHNPVQAERHALEQCVLELAGKSAALKRWLAENEAKKVDGAPPFVVGQYCVWEHVQGGRRLRAVCKGCVDAKA